MIERELLRKALGAERAEFRPGQLEAIRTITQDGQRLLAVQRTGWGKSMVYFLATRARRDEGRGPTLVVSPLIALMRSQLTAARRVDLRAAAYHSGNAGEWRAIERRICKDELDLLIVSPERLARRGFVDACLGAPRGIGMLVIDEAHCISDWGHDFRPDYRRLYTLLERLPGSVPVLATTATANRRVIDDIRRQLGVQVALLRGPMARKSLRLDALTLTDAAERLAWLAAVVPSLPGSGIIYALRKADARRVARFLRSVGISAEAYQGNLEAARRESLERALLDDEVKCLVSTSALGLGFDKPDLGFVIHYQAPQSLVHYYQQVGRAGRAVDEAVGVMLHGSEDARINRHFIAGSFPSEAHLARVLGALDCAARGLSEPELERRANLTAQQCQGVLRVLSSEEPAPVLRDGNRWYRTTHAFRLDYAGLQERVRIRQREWQAVLAYAAADTCLMRFLCQAVGDDDLADCGRCVVCAGRWLPARPPTPLVRSARAFLNGTGVIEVRPRRAWASGAFPVYQFSGAISDALAVQDGVALCRWGDGRWGELVRAGKARERFDGELVRRMVEVVRPRFVAPGGWVTCVPSLRRPSLVSGLAAEVAAALELPFRPCVRKVRETPPQKEQASVFRQAANLDGAFAVESPVPAGPVLLVDDVCDSGWTFTVVGALLRRAGCAAVFPVALASAAQVP